MESKLNYKFTKKAANDLDEIVRYIKIDLENPIAASNFIDCLLKTIDEIRIFPESGSFVHNEFLISKNIRKKLIKNYIMYYLYDSKNKIIFILRIIYGKREMSEILNYLF